MGQTSQMKVASELLRAALDKVLGHKARGEDILFRAQRIAAALKNNQAVRDPTFGIDFGAFRKMMRTLSQETSELGPVVGRLEKEALPDPETLREAQSLLRLATNLVRETRDLQDFAQRAYQHIRQAEYKTEAWSMTQDVERAVANVESLPGRSAAVLRKMDPEGVPEPLV